MSKFNPETQKSIRIVLDNQDYNSLKKHCLDYGDVSRVIRFLLKKWLADPKSSLRQVYEDAEALRAKLELKSGEEKVS